MWGQKAFVVVVLSFHPVCLRDRTQSIRLANKSHLGISLTLNLSLLEIKTKSTRLQTLADWIKMRDSEYAKCIGFFKWQICLRLVRECCFLGRIGLELVSAQQSTLQVSFSPSLVLLQFHSPWEDHIPLAPAQTAARLEWSLEGAKSLVQLSNAQSCGQPPDNSTKQKSICEHGCVRSGGEGWGYTVSSYTTNYRHLRKTILAGF